LSGLEVMSKKLSLASGPAWDVVVLGEFW
jgi:hypothetical protein